MSLSPTTPWSISSLCFLLSDNSYSNLDSHDKFGLFSCCVPYLKTNVSWSKIISHSTSSCHVSGLVYLPTSFFSNAKMHFSSKCHWITSVSMEFNVQNMGMLSIIVTNVFGFHEKYYFSYFQKKIQALNFLNIWI